MAKSLYNLIIGMIPSEINIHYDSKCSIFTQKQFPIELKTLDGLDINISLILTDTSQMNLKPKLSLP